MHSILSDYSPQEQEESVGWKLIQLFTLPSTIVELPVAEHGEEIRTIRVKMRLLSDKEMLEVQQLADRYGFVSRTIISRREILARAIEWVEEKPLEMPKELKSQLKASGARVTELDEKRWVLEHMQPIVLQLLQEEYDKLLEQQAAAVAEIKKKFDEQQGISQQLTNLSPESIQSTDTSSTDSSTE